MTDPVSRIDALTRNARNTWFALLAALVFVGVTLLSVSPIDFYGVGRATQLPLVGVSVPTDLFFYTAPVLVVAIYAFFHIYLVRLWDALSRAKPRVGGETLSDAITPWLICDTALYLRRLMRKDGCVVARPLDFPSAFWNIVFAWFAGPLVLGYLWYKSLPARDWIMSGIAATMIIFAMIFFVASAIMLVLRMHHAPKHGSREVHFVSLWTIVVWVFLSLPIAFETWHRTHPNGKRPAALDLAGEDIVERPEGWVPYALAKTDFYATWCKREELSCKIEELEDSDRDRFEDEWRDRRAINLADLRKPRWSSQSRKPGLDGANLANTFLSGANLNGAQMEGADLREAQMEGADLSGAQMEGADLIGAQVEGADLIGAQMEGADLSFAQMEGAVLLSAQMEGADLSLSHLTGTAQRVTFLQSTNLGASTNHGGALRFVDLRTIEYDFATDFRNTFLDGSVDMTPEFRAQMGAGAATEPCQWASERLPDDQFYGRWRGWLEDDSNPQLTEWSSIAPPGFEDVTPIPPPDGCKWKTGPMPAAPKN